MADGIFEMPIDQENSSIYLTFDDGPIPEITEFVLDELSKYNAKATFFVVGNNIVSYPEIFERIKKEGHSYGNHTFNHLKGSSTKTLDYIEDVERASRFINSKLFRPPYGRIKNKQAEILVEKGYQIVFWSLLSADFDQDITPERCLENVLLNIEPGDVIVMHDSKKAFANLEYALPRILAFCEKQKWEMKAIPM